ncbi:MAG: hypothetical protein QOJ07_3367 [Thermoleophilaceae bacterium]|nr:hypothetical protein [Thermoleophilaceae bacterium]
MNAVTGVFSYTGNHIARRLLADGEQVRTLSRAPDPDHPLADQVEFARLQFDDPIELLDALAGVDTLYNTYWVRYARGETTWQKVVDNTAMLLRAAGAAGVSRVVHVSVTRAAPDSPLDYYRHKALTEQIVREAPLSYAIVRPTLVFARGDILLNNIAWLMRRFPLFVVPGDGSYPVQPVAARDVAALCVEAARRSEDLEWDAAGPATYSYEELVRVLHASVHSRARIVHARPGAALALGRLVGGARRDTLLTRPELDGLMDGLLTSPEPPRGMTRIEDWLAGAGGGLGRDYASERRRNWSGD